MKKTILLMLGLVAGAASFAPKSVAQTSDTPGPQTHLVMTADQKIRLYVQPIEADGKLTIVDASGHALYTANVDLHKGLGYQFDVSGLSYGTYQFLLKSGTDVITKTFVVQPAPNESFIMLKA